MIKKDKFFTVMIIPHDAQRKPISFKIPLPWIWGAGALLVFFMLYFVSSFVYSTHLTRRLVYYMNTMAKNREQKEVISSFTGRTEKINQAISELAGKDNELRKMLGLKNWKSKIKLSTDSHVPDELKKIAERKESLAELRVWVDYLRQRFVATPSGWPLYGKLVSWFGYRVYPWRGFHSGIDISTRYGSPVRVTAAGRVSYVGWRAGYGKTVIVDHGYGVSTLYGHNSAYAVRVGQAVRRGQVVSYVGTTGYTTGPHLHYEVRRWERPLNPVAYLNLNLLTASRLWAR